MINSCRVKQALVPQKRHCNQESDDVFQKILKTCLVVSLIVLVITFEILLTTTLSSSSLIKSTATITLKQTKKIIPLLTTTISEAVMTTATAATVSYDYKANSMSVIYTKFINEDQLILSNLAFANSNNIIIQCSTSRSRVDNRDNNQRRKDKLIHSTFRINQFVIKSLEEEANKRRVSLGSLVNSILENYVSSEMYFEQL